MRLLNISTPCRGGVVFLLLVNNCRPCKLVKPHRVNEWMETVVISTRSCYRTEIILRYRNYFLAFTMFYIHDCWPFFFCFVFVQLFQGNLLSNKPVLQVSRWNVKLLLCKYSVCVCSVCASGSKPLPSSAVTKVGIRYFCSRESNYLLSQSSGFASVDGTICSSYAITNTILTKILLQISYLRFVRK